MKRRVWLALCMTFVLAFSSLIYVSAEDITDEGETPIKVQEDQSNNDDKNDLNKDNENKKEESEKIEQDDEKDSLVNKTEETENTENKENAENTGSPMLFKAPRAMGDVTITIGKNPEKPDIGGAGEITVTLENTTGSPISLEGWTLQSYGEFAYENAADPSDQMMLPAEIKTYGAGDTIAAGGTKVETVNYKVPKWWELCGTTMEGGIMLLNKDQEVETDEEMSLTISEVGKPSELEVTVTPGKDMSKIYQNVVYPFTITVKNNSANVLNDINVNSSLYFDENGGIDWLYSKETYERSSNVEVHVVQYDSSTYDPAKGKRPDTEVASIKELQPGASISFNGTIMLLDKIDKVHTGRLDVEAMSWGADPDIPESYGLKQIYAQILPSTEAGNNGPATDSAANGGARTGNTASANGSVRTGDTAPVTILLVCMGISALLGIVAWKRRADGKIE